MIKNIDKTLMQKDNFNSQIDIIPIEILLTVIQYLDAKSILSLALTAKKYYEACQDTSKSMLKHETKNLISPDDNISGINKARILVFRERIWLKKINNSIKEQSWFLYFLNNKKERDCKNKNDLEFIIANDDSQQLPTLFPEIMAKDSSLDFHMNIMSDDPINAELLHPKISPLSLKRFIQETLHLIVLYRAYKCFDLLCRLLLKTIVLIENNKVLSSYLRSYIIFIKENLDKTSDHYFLQTFYYHVLVIFNFEQSILILGNVSATTVLKFFQEYPLRWYGLYQKLEFLEKELSQDDQFVLQDIYYYTLIMSNDYNLIKIAIEKASENTIKKFSDDNPEKWEEINRRLSTGNNSDDNNNVSIQNSELIINDENQARLALSEDPSIEIENNKNQVQVMSVELLDKLASPVSEKLVNELLSLHYEIGIRLKTISSLIDSVPQLEDTHMSSRF